MVSGVVDRLLTVIEGGDDRVLKNSVRQHITVFLWRWLIDRLTDGDYSKWRSRLVDRLLIACERENGGNSDA